MSKKLFRQGDVLLQYFGKQLPSDKKAPLERLAPDNLRVVLAYGEVTGHAHALDAKVSTLYKWEGDTLLEVKETTALKHEEHSSITLEPGVYKVIQQKEYAPAAIRRVSD
jgi:hypothetical protein